MGMTLAVFKDAKGFDVEGRVSWDVKECALVRLHVRRSTAPSNTHRMRRKTTFRKPIHNEYA